MRMAICLAIICVLCAAAHAAVIGKATVSTSAAATASLTIDKVQVTREAQTVINEIRNNDFGSSKLNAEAGQSFLIVGFTLVVPDAEVEVEFSKDLLWADPTGKQTVRGYAKMSDSKIWNAFFSGRKFAKGRHPYEMLYVVPSDQVAGSSIRLVGKDYALSIKGGQTQPKPRTIGKVTVTADQAPIMQGKETILTAKKGDTFDVTEVKGDWFGVLPSHGWIHKANVRFDAAPAGAIPAEVDGGIKTPAHSGTRTDPPGEGGAGKQAEGVDETTAPAAEPSSVNKPANPAVKATFWIPSFYLAGGPPGTLAPEVKPAGGKRLLLVLADLGFPRGRVWDLSGIFLRMLDGSEVRLLAFSYHQPHVAFDYASAGADVALSDHGDVLPLVGVTPAVERELKLPTKRFNARFIGKQWFGGTHLLHLIFELPETAKPMQLIAGGGSCRITDDMIKPWGAGAKPR